ncbi:MAG: hypothetical protein HY548_05010, partial [Elusimicrobia bacterium]|nr:hypothetical protein [Elusimicrobiota bacterium]
MILKRLAGILLVGLFLTACGNGTTTTTVTANAGDDQDALVGDKATLDGQASTGVNSALWTFESKPTGSSATLSSSTSLAPTFTADVAGEYEIKLSLNNNADTDTVVVTAKNVIAAITVGSSSAIGTRTRLGQAEYVINLDETGGVLSGATSRGSITSYSWEQVSGPGATQTGGTTNATLEFTGPSFSDLMHESDHYKWQVFPVSRDDTKMVFRLTVTNSSGNSDSAAFTVYVEDENVEIHTASGLTNVAIGETVYLCGASLDASGASTTVTANEEGDPVTDWSWTLTSMPSGSSATFRNSGSTSSSVQCPNFIPDKAGLYEISYSSSTGNSTSTVTAVKTPGTLNVSAAEWVGVGTVGGTTPVSPQCANCHDGTIEADKVTEWSNTVHAAKFQNSMETYEGLAPTPYLWQFHTVGFNEDAVNGGFDDLANTSGFTFPEGGLTFSTFVSSEPDLAKLANIQCENCHGPGSQHDGSPTHIAYSLSSAGVCGQCHIQETQWKNSAHNMTGVKHGSGAYQSAWLGTGCERCHSAKGFQLFVEGGWSALVSLVADAQGGFVGATCAACHDPHNAANERQLRLAGNVTMAIDGSTVNAGKAAVCYTCHDGNYSLNQTSCDVNGDGSATTADDDATAGVATTDGVCSTKYGTAIGAWRGGMHYTVQSPMLEGKQAVTDLNNDGTNDLTLDENSFHSGTTFTLADVTGDSTLSSANNKCVTCHMAEGPSQDEEGYQHLGGHAFKLRSGHAIGHLQGTDEGDESASTAEDLQLTSACTVCHASVTEFNRE